MSHTDLKREARNLADTTGTSRPFAKRRVVDLYATADHYSATGEGPFTLLPEQAKAAAAIVAQFREDTKALVIRPWQTGKTVIAADVARQIDAKTTLVVGSRPARVKNMEAVWRQHRPDSELTSIVERATVANRVADFVNAGVTPRVLFTTYTQLRSVEAALKEHGNFTLDLACFEDAHELLGRGATVERRATRLNARARLFATAMPEMFVDGSTVVSLENGAFGRTVSELAYGSAVAHRLLCPCATSAIDINDYELADSEIVFGVDVRDVSVARKRELAALAIGLVMTARRENLHRIVAFIPTIDEARAFAAVLNRVYAYVAAHDKPHTLQVQEIDHRATQNARVKVSTWFASPARDTRILVNPELAAVDEVSAIADGVFLADPIESGAVGVEAIARSMRPTRSKVRTRAIVPLERRPGETSREAIRREAELHDATVFRMLDAIESQRAAPARSASTVRRPGGTSSSIMHQAIDVDFTDGQLREVEAAVSVEDVRAAKRERDDNLQSMADVQLEHDAPSDADRPAALKSPTLMPTRSMDPLSDENWTTTLERWESGDLGIKVKKSASRQRRWQHVDPKYRKVRREMFEFDMRRPRDYEYKKLLTTEKPATKSSYRTDVRGLSKRDLRRVVNSLPEPANPGEFGRYAADIKIRVDAATAALLRCRRLEEDPGVAVDAFVAQLERREPDLDLRYAKRPGKPETSSDCRAIGRYYAAIVLDGGQIDRNGRIARWPRTKLNVQGGPTTSEKRRRRPRRR